MSVLLQYIHSTSESISPVNDFFSEEAFHRRRCLFLFQTVFSALQKRAESDREDMEVFFEKLTHHRLQPVVGKSGISDHWLIPGAMDGAKGGIDEMWMGCETCQPNFSR